MIRLPESIYEGLPTLYVVSGAVIIATASLDSLNTGLAFVSGAIFNAVGTIIFNTRLIYRTGGGMSYDYRGEDALPKPRD